MRSDIDRKMIVTIKRWPSQESRVVELPGANRTHVKHNVLLRDFTSTGYNLHALHQLGDNHLFSNFFLFYVAVFRLCTFQLTILIIIIINNGALKLVSNILFIYIVNLLLIFDYIDLLYATTTIFINIYNRRFLHVFIYFLSIWILIFIIFILDSYDLT